MREDWTRQQLLALQNALMAEYDRLEEQPDVDQNRLNEIDLECEKIRWQIEGRWR